MISLETFKLREVEFKNRIVMPPMCMRQAGLDGRANDFHKIHYGTRSMGGVGLIIVEATAVEPNGRIRDEDLGIWNSKHVEGLSEIARSSKAYGSKVGIQLGHAGRKSLVTNGKRFGPSQIDIDDTYGSPLQLSKEGIKTIVSQFQDGAKRADEAGFDVLEIHAAHGFLIHQFLSPLTNKRTDSYGGSLTNRLRFLKEILGSVRKVWPSGKPIILRISADDYIDGGIDINESIKIVNELKVFIDMVHVSSGGLLEATRSEYPGYQIHYSKKIREACKIPTIAVGLITEMDMVENTLKNREADMVALGRELLRNPYFVLEEARLRNIDYDFPEAYRPAY